jgi:hypothetical protein
MPCMDSYTEEFTKIGTGEVIWWHQRCIVCKKLCRKKVHLALNRCITVLVYYFEVLVVLSSSVTLTFNPILRAPPSFPGAIGPWTYGVPKIRGRMSIRVSSYDFIFSKSCYICEPISHIILLRAPQCYIFCRTVAFYYYDNSSSPLLLPLPWRCRGGLLLWKGSGSNRGFETTVIDRSIVTTNRSTARSESS